MALEAIVLGIDGLEFSLVEKWNLKNLMQNKYTKLDLSDYSVIVTPPIWGSMITGKIDKEIFKIWERTAAMVGLQGDIKIKRSVNISFKILGLFPKSIQDWIMNNIFDNLSDKNAFDLTANYVKEKNLENIFQFFKNPWDNGLPSYGRNIYSKEKRKLWKEAAEGNKIPLKDITIKDYNIDKSQLLSALKIPDNDFIFWYTTLLDTLGHMFIDKEVDLLNYYLEINSLVGEVIKKYPNIKTYIISDHGMKTTKEKWGVHSKYAFFSSSTGELINKPVELFDLIKKQINVKN